LQIIEGTGYEWERRRDGWRLYKKDVANYEFGIYLGGSSTTDMLAAAKLAVRAIGNQQ
jgi:hypothetical protein